METLVPFTAMAARVSGAACLPRHVALTSEAGSPVCALARKLDGLASLTNPDRAALEDLGGYVRPVERYAVLAEQGGVADHALIVFAGFAGRYKCRVSGRRQILAFLVPGDFCDRGALHGYALDHEIEALTKCQVAMVPRPAYLDLLGRHPRIAIALQRARLAEEATAREWMVSTGMRSGLERMAHLLCELLERLGSIGHVTNGQYDLPLTQTDLADALGMSSVHVNRVLQALRRDRLIATRGRRLQVLAPQRLSQVAEFEAGYL